LLPEIREFGAKHEIMEERNRKEEACNSSTNKKGGKGWSLRIILGSPFQLKGKAQRAASACAQ